MKTLYAAGLALAWGMLAAGASAAPVAPEAKPKATTQAKAKATAKAEED